jgi:hypothetical protein
MKQGSPFLELEEDLSAVLDEEQSPHQNVVEVGAEGTPFQHEWSLPFDQQDQVLQKPVGEYLQNGKDADKLHPIAF